MTRSCPLIVSSSEDYAEMPRKWFSTGKTGIFCEATEYHLAPSPGLSLNSLKLSDSLGGSRMTLSGRGYFKWFINIYQFTILHYVLCSLHNEKPRTMGR